MTGTTLYFAPGSCARVVLILLEEIGRPFSLQTVAFLAGEHKRPEYLVLNPKGKVPALAIDGLCLSENVAIIDYLADRFPRAALMPSANTAKARAERLADLSFCASTLHPIVTRIRMAPFFAGPTSARAVWQKGCEAMDEYFELIDNRLDNSDWWYGQAWSAMDAYLNWVFYRVSGARYDTSRFCNFERHAASSKSRPAIQRALAKEREAEEDLEARGLLFVPPDPAEFA